MVLAPSQIQPLSSRKVPAKRATEAAGGASLRQPPETGVEELIEVLRERGAAHHDRVVEVKNLRMDPDDGSLRVDGEALGRPTRHALGQLGVKLGIPGAYLAKCDHTLRAENVNRWLSRFATGRSLSGATDLLADDGPEEPDGAAEATAAALPARRCGRKSPRLLLRMDGMRIRAVLSPRYRPLDNLQLVQSLVGMVSPDTPIRYELSETHFALQVVDNGHTARGDALYPGLHVENSEVGASAVTLSAFIYRQICLNGLILRGGQVTWSRRHVGRTELAGVLRAEMPRLLDAGRSSVETFRGTQTVAVATPLHALESISTRYQLTGEQQMALKAAFEIEPGNTLYHVINSVTRAGNSEELGFDARRRLQEVGGRMLDLSAKGLRWLD